MRTGKLTIASVALMDVLFCNQGLAAGILVEGEFRRPESVEYYAAEDVYLVTNINGSPDLADDNGFISKISPEGELLELKWLDGTRPEVHLEAPKGYIAAVCGTKYQRPPRFLADTGSFVGLPRKLP